MIRFFESWEEITVYQGETDDPYMEVNNAVFKRDFGPWKKGERCEKMRFDYKRNYMAEYNASGERVKMQDVRIVTANDKLAQIIKWLDQEDDDTLFTKDGRKVYRFYAGTLIDKFMRDLYDEVRPETIERSNPDEPQTSIQQHS